MSHFERSWKGKIRTNWDNDSDTGGRTFRLHPSDFAFTDPSHGTFRGDGSSYNGRAFDIKHGKWHERSDSTLHITFDMKFISGEPTERFSGTLNTASTKLTGTIKLKDPSQYDTGYTQSAYADYHCSVTLH